MFESLTDKFNSVFRSLAGRGRITEANISDAMRDVRKALLEADVSYNVVKAFCKDVTQAAIGADVIKSLHPSQVDIAKRVFSPAPDEVKFARRILEAMPDGTGVAMLDGKMQDDATWKQAKVIADLADLVASKDPDLAAAYNG